MDIKLNKAEYLYLLNNNFLSKEILDILLLNVKMRHGKYFLTLPEEIVDQVHEKLENQLQCIGFDNEDEITQEGIIIESLIDKFFSG